MKSDSDMVGSFRTNATSDQASFCSSIPIAPNSAFRHLDTIFDHPEELARLTFVRNLLEVRRIRISGLRKTSAISPLAHRGSWRNPALRTLAHRREPLPDCRDRLGWYRGHDDQSMPYEFSSAPNSRCRIRLACRYVDVAAKKENRGADSGYNRKNTEWLLTSAQRHLRRVADFPPLLVTSQRTFLGTSSRGTVPVCYRLTVLWARKAVSCCVLTA